MFSAFRQAFRSLGRATLTTQTTPTSTTSALGLIQSQPGHYLIANFVGKRYILTPRDVLTVPRLKDVKVGDVIALNAIHEVGSRDYTLRGNPISPQLVKVDATVIEHTKSRMEIKFKKKRRKGYRKTIKSKHPYTRLRIGEIQFSTPNLLSQQHTTIQSATIS